jgi:hypothetical protein
MNDGIMRDASPSAVANKPSDVRRGRNPALAKTEYSTAATKTATKHFFRCRSCWLEAGGGVRQTTLKCRIEVASSNEIYNLVVSPIRRPKQ